MDEFEGLVELRAVAQKLGHLTGLSAAGNTGAVRSEIGKISLRTATSQHNCDSRWCSTSSEARAEVEYRLAERAAILEFDGGMTRTDAERLARADITDFA
jgi:hypothetical protein